MRRAIACIVALSVASTAAANAPADYAYVFSIETPASAASGANAWRVELTPEVYRFVQDANLRDVEVFNADGKPVPMARIAIEPATTSREERSALDVLVPETRLAAPEADDLRVHIERDADGRVRNIAVGEGGRDAAPMRTWLVDAGKFDHAIESLALSWREPASGIVARFEVDASDDLEHWRHVATGTVLALEQGGAKLERRDIALGGVRAKYLRLRRLDDGTAMNGLAVEARSIERGRAAPSRVWIDASPAPVQTEPNATTRAARYDYTLVAPLPVETARVELRNDNALAEIELLGRAAGTTTAPWLPVAHLTAFRLRQGDEPLRNGDVDLAAGRRLGEFRIESATTIAEAPKLAFAYRPDAFVFLAEGSGPFVLGAGSASARRPDYPVEPALASLRATLGKDWQPPSTSLGAPKASGGEAVLHAAPAPLPWRRWVLWAVLVGGAALIAAFSLSLLRGAKRGE
jgi:uncharacterized protein DUF3999